MKTEQILALGMIGLAAFLFLQSQQRRSYPPPPPQQASGNEWQEWADRIINIFGNAKWLWEPGGPFYKGGSNQLGVDPSLLPNYEDYA